MIAAYTQSFPDQVDVTLKLIGDLLKEKNLKYGNSALDPMRVFSKASPEEQLLVRIDDKLSRMRNQKPNEDEDVVLDLVGYLVLLLMVRKPLQ